MINKNTSLSTDAADSFAQEYPFMLFPAGKEYLWGGTRLKDDFAKEFDTETLAETWECATHPDGTSKVVSGEFAGELLSEVLKRHPEFLGTHPQTLGNRSEDGNVLPILIKFIDAKKDLSVQVHPDDAYAREHENGSLGKTEMWYVMEASKDAKLVYGFHHEMKPETVRKSIADGTIERYLQKVPIKKGDVFFLPAGCVHAVGAGALIAEVQESSNLTYRLYDYDRVDKNGHKRPLHIEKALQVADLKGAAEPRQPMRVYQFRNGMATELLCRCRYFQVERVLLNTENRYESAKFQTGSNSFQVLLCMEGSGSLQWNKTQEELNFSRGDCIFVPADSEMIRIHGKAQLLKVGC